MAQNYTMDMFAPDNQIAVDMQNMEHCLECLRSMFSGLNHPTDATPGQVWYDLGKSVLKQHDGTGWIGLMHGDAQQKVWIYRDDAMIGWVIDTTTSDLVLAIKSTAAGQVYSTAGANAGTWSISGIVANLPSHTHSISAAGSHRHACGSTGAYGIGFGDDWLLYAPCLTDYQGNHAHGGATGASAASTIPASGDGTWRPAAAVGTLQYLDL